MKFVRNHKEVHPKSRRREQVRALAGIPRGISG
jgi:hypothetical protein